ncbi:hypothetical protein AVEN_44442-1 [Araneus ventricosus]|uniref:Reverse transcriptase domain-containing protein n=1 Tax=Araneus ventricosus TaxID=182803 RepID=A0A4Y2PP81_ARAVE|nr:hypothetical protein AVEN_44442-1 [Araneus ventricosus]
MDLSKDVPQFTRSLRPSAQSREIKKINNTAMIALDIKGTFDSMVWSRLLTIIHKMAYLRQLFLIIKVYLNNRLDRIPYELWNHQKITVKRLSTKFQASTHFFGT